IMDLQNENCQNEVDEQILRQTHIKKTGALIKSACEMGVLAAHATEEARIDAIKFGGELGLAFQIVDDILDVEGDCEKLGKPVGNDGNKTTFVTLFGLETAKIMANEATERAMNILKQYENSDFLQFLTQTMLDRKA
ncbi:MAG: polyprenyl synthetase family protein, partial [Oscillospiraceae bacterium]